MKNTTISHEASYPLVPALRVAFKHEEIVEEKSSKNGKSKRKADKVNVEPSKKELPLYNDYRIKARDHDPL